MQRFVDKQGRFCIISCVWCLVLLNFKIIFTTTNTAFDLLWEVRMDIGRKLKDLRVMKGLTQEELADRAELTKGFISQLERNLTSPSIATLMDILQCLGTNIGDFFNEETEEQIVFSKGDYFEKLDSDLKNKI